MILLIGLLILANYQEPIKTMLFSMTSLSGAKSFEIPAKGSNTVATTDLYNGRIPSLSWIVGRDCQRGIEAYLRNVENNPDAALVGTGWVNPLTGALING